MRGPLVEIPICRLPDVTRSDRLKGNVSVTYVTFCVLKEGTETSCPIATAAVPPLSGRVTSSTPQRKPEYVLHLLPTYIYIYAFSRRFYPKRLTIAFRLYIFISTCVPWESNPQSFAQLTQCGQRQLHAIIACQCALGRRVSLR